ncbi:MULTISPECIES: META domain-containing protein [Novosphingobium]|uniref:Heat shock protein HslJ n=1 Tax=Novosphingobium mathurense TaxID=428990 RepID=A0A1U6H1W8_9SPHN|nr:MULTISPECIES: META domain-containing protein [Novosphingobium]CDO34718.1 conserved exported hypothetical protein [Novosphingobium sp. KN65.2]SLJ89726.1 heat shock protein HslJ [Novosphingobium mathurense]
MLLRSALILALSLGAASCGTGPKADVQLKGSAWRFALIDGKRPSTDAADLVFLGSKIRVQIGCNLMEGRWHVEDDRLVAASLNQSEVPCSKPVWGQEKAVIALLVATPRLAVDDDRMIIQSSGHTAELVRDLQTAK